MKIEGVNMKFALIWVAIGVGRQMGGGGHMNLWLVRWAGALDTGGDIPLYI